MQARPPSPSPASEGSVNQAQDGSWIVVWIPLGASRLLAIPTVNPTHAGSAKLGVAWSV